MQLLAAETVQPSWHQLVALLERSLPYVRTDISHRDGQNMDSESYTIHPVPLQDSHCECCNDLSEQ